jgi:two-component system phosphate regulon sensor histidine kinase PhoR
VDRSRNRDSGGTGLGLAIVKHVLQRHDADLEVESEPGKGSVFTCHFPMERVAREARSA